MKDLPRWLRRIGSAVLLALAASAPDARGQDVRRADVREQHRPSTARRVRLFRPTSVAVADLNGDGHVDLAVAQGDADVVSILSGTGAATFGPPQTFPVGDWPHALAVGDFNHDGLPDVAVGNTSSVTVSLLLGRAVGGFETRTIPVRSEAGLAGPTALASGDFNSDGRLDLAVLRVHLTPFPTEQSSVLVLIATGAGGLQAAGQYPVETFSFGSLAAGDVDRDGNLDIVAGSWLLRGTGGGVFAAPVRVAGGGNSVELRDVSGDGWSDLVATSSGRLLLSLGDGIGGFGPPASFSLTRVFEDRLGGFPSRT